MADEKALLKKLSQILNDNKSQQQETKQEQIETSKQDSDEVKPIPLGEPVKMSNNVVKNPQS